MIFPGLIIAFLRPLSRESGVSGKRGQGARRAGPAFCIRNAAGFSLSGRRGGRKVLLGAGRVSAAARGASNVGPKPGGDLPAGRQCRGALSAGGQSGQKAMCRAPPRAQKSRRTRVGAAVLQMLKVRKELTSVPPWRQPLPASSSSRRRRPWKQPPSGSWERCRPGPSLPSGPDR